MEGNFMALSKDKLVFDETDLDNSDQVGAHVIGSAGEKITSTDVGGKEGLDVNVINTINVALDSEFAEDSAHSDADVGQHILAVRQDTLASSTSTDGDYSSFKVNSLGELYTHDVDLKAEMVLANTSLDAIEASVAAIDVDTSSIITELQSVNTELDSQTTLLTSLDGKDFATETTLAAIEAQTSQFTFNSGRLEVLADIRLESDVADDEADTENPFKVGSRAVDGALTAISASGDKANVISDMYRRVYVNDAPNVGFKTSAATITDTASEVASSPLLGRKRIMIQNLGNKSIFIGFDNTVSILNGLRISAGGFLEMPFGEDLDIYSISESGSQDIRVVEIA